MGDGIYIGMAGAVARSQQLESIADNLANAGSPGFKAARPAFESFLAPGSKPGDRSFVAAVSTGIDLRPGPTQRTGNPLDVTPEEGHFLATRQPDGNVGYTRDGRVSVTPQGELRAAGGALLDLDGKPIHVPPSSAVSITNLGQVMADSVEVGRIATFRLEGKTERTGTSTLQPTAQGAATLAEGHLRVGELELGNSSPLEAAVSMVSVQRHYDSSMQAIEAYKKMGDRSNELGRVR